MQTEAPLGDSISPTRYRQLRGLVIHFNQQWPEVRQGRRFQRALIPTFATLKGERGICRWCRLPLADGSQRRWDPG